MMKVEIVRLNDQSQIVRRSMTADEENQLELQQEDEGKICSYLFVGVLTVVSKISHDTEALYAQLLSAAPPVFLINLRTFCI
jgi:hypothetical protein